MLADETKEALRTIEEFALRFKVNAFSLKNTALSKKVKTVRSIEMATELTRAYLDLAEQAGREQRYDDAGKAAKAASSMARRSKNRELMSLADTKRKQFSGS